MDEPLFVVRIPTWYTPAAGAMCLAFGAVLWRKAGLVMTRRTARILAVAIAIGLPVFIALYARHGVVVFNDRIEAVWRFGSGVMPKTTVYPAQDIRSYDTRIIQGKRRTYQGLKLRFADGSEIEVQSEYGNYGRLRPWLAQHGIPRSPAASPAS
jgi:hypothetical protein